MIYEETKPSTLSVEKEFKYKDQKYEVHAEVSISVDEYSINIEKIYNINDEENVQDVTDTASESLMNTAADHAVSCAESMQ